MFWETSLILAFFLIIVITEMLGFVRVDKFYLYL